jgi:putative flippase GtrA
MNTQFKFIKIIKYFFVGGIAAVLDISIFYVFAQKLGYNYLIVGPIGFILATLLNYYLSIKLVFKKGTRFSPGMELLAIFVVSTIALIINQICLYISIDMLHMHKMLAKIGATGIVFFWNYFLRNNYVFKTAKAQVQ